MPPAAGPARQHGDPCRRSVAHAANGGPAACSSCEVECGRRTRANCRHACHFMQRRRSASLPACRVHCSTAMESPSVCMPDHATHGADGVGPPRSGLSRLLQSSRFARWPAYRRTSSVTLRSSRPRAFEWCGLCGSRTSLTCRRVYFCRVQHPIFPLRRLLNH